MKNKKLCTWKGDVRKWYLYDKKAIHYKSIIILLKRVCDLKFMIYIKYQSFVQNNR